jgi:hypothetical protein
MAPTIVVVAFVSDEKIKDKTICLLKRSICIQIGVLLGSRISNISLFVLVVRLECSKLVESG